MCNDSLPPLNKVRVIDFGHSLAGPLAGMLLADQGAEVIKINRPKDDDEDIRPSEVMFNRGKKILDANLKEGHVREKVKALLATTDVVVENFRPGVMKRLGIDYQTIKEINPAVIYLSMPGFPSGNMSANETKALEGLLCAGMGMYENLHLYRNAIGLRPAYSSLPLASAYAAIHGAVAITMALYDRENSGNGEHIEVPLSSAGISCMSQLIFSSKKHPARYNVPPLSFFTRKVILPMLRKITSKNEDSQQRKWLKAMAKMTPPFFDSFKTKDDKSIFVCAIEHDASSRKLVEALGIEKDITREGIVSKNPYRAGRLTNNINDAGLFSRRLKNRVRELMAVAFKTKEALEWEKLLNEAGVSCAMQRTTSQWLDDPEVIKGGLSVELETEQFGTMKQMGTAVSLKSTAIELQIPKKSQKISFDDIASLTSSHKPFSGTKKSDEKFLEGLKVLDLSTVIAAPICGKTLSEYGAEVIKIDPVQPHFGPRFHCWFATEVNHGKKSMLLNLKSEEGKRIAQDLIKKADVVIHNFRPGKSSILHLDFDRVKAINPGIVYCSISAFEGIHQYSHSNYPGFDPTIQAATGVMMRYGDDEPVPHGVASCIDYMCGFSAAYGVALALFKKKATNSAKAEWVNTSLARNAALSQAPFMYTGKGIQKPLEESRGQWSRGVHSLYYMYKASDGWIFLSGFRSDIFQMQKIRELAKIPTNPDDEHSRIEFLNAALITHPYRYWKSMFKSINVGCGRVNDLNYLKRHYTIDITTDDLSTYRPGNSKFEVVSIKDHSCGNPVQMVPPAQVRFDNYALKFGQPFPKVGSDTKSILCELGYGDAAFNAMKTKGVVSDSLKKKYFPD